MTSSAAEHPTQVDAPPRHVDVLIVGGGVSGIGCAYHLQTEQPAKSYVILEARDATGGTWDIFRFPGIRSDSDLHTFGYEFKPWRDEKAIADGPSILRYIRETENENGIGRHIRLNHKVTRAEWSSEQALWTVEVSRPTRARSSTTHVTGCSRPSGYFSYDEGYTPDFQGRERFQGEIAHPSAGPRISTTPASAWS